VYCPMGTKWVRTLSPIDVTITIMLALWRGESVLSLGPSTKMGAAKGTICPYGCINYPPTQIRYCDIAGSCPYPACQSHGCLRSKRPQVRVLPGVPKKSRNDGDFSVSANGSARYFFTALHQRCTVKSVRSS
jgi:hypothetical protein